jgi:hypothetical protein
MGAEKRRLIKKCTKYSIFYVDKVTRAAYGHIKSGENINLEVVRTNKQ